ncbi:pentatricopeptide repeat-containing protein At1g02060, chloroplastic-like [Asparagus officinalis]|uniref:pentatricopeptide repeat-containing protein At1g02060, chloroplastic-like n=1 Tax=Asparagus officinalis TaxID=4686 RepID=UPI00098E5C9C|nr:pentatricopeptide repeat-containing protein At1g02060, chloroplastic-like [Asparagus officinalis]XP_020240740.1 pentatricopeptide repeat-containing protein At1g02060, chloroplastic-like [Asparagus officinalis]XP_020240741.1 pentatricopeptide repeat-containing protein At1g02060, chloroplastic-like [Asparagus officinalis]XP_020240742.1 pentatricopeptide repeat-containing protein At1g02060, chloroplastic-like [Asparagus officinalis]
MLDSRIAPDICTFNTLIRGFCLNRSVDEGFELFRDMGGYGCCPDVVTYNTLLDGLCRAGKVETARNFLGGMKRRGGDSSVSPNVVSYTTLIRGFCGCGDVVRAVEVFDEMVGMGVKPNKVTYNTLVKGLCEAKRMDLVKELLEREDAVFKPDTCTFNTLMAAHCDFGRADDAVKVFERMLELRVKTDSASYSTLIRGFCKSGEFKRAEELVDEILEKGVLKRRGVCVPLMAAYNPILDHFCHNGKANRAGMLMRELIERRATIDIGAFKTVILGYCREGELREAYKLLVSMVRRNLNPDFEVFEVLVEGFSAKEDHGFAWKALERMLNCGHRPRTSTFHSVLAGLLKKDGFAEEAGNLVAVMVERKVRHHIDLSTGVVASLLGMGLNDRAFEIVGLLYDNGYCVKMEKLAESLYKGNKYLEARDLLLFSLKRNETLDAEVHARVINSLCATGKAAEAFELFYAVNEKGSGCVISSCLNDLRDALEKIGKFREAEFVSKQMNRLETVPDGDKLIRAQNDMTHRKTTNFRKIQNHNGNYKAKVSSSISETRWPYKRSVHAS